VTERLELRAGGARAEVLPGMGGALAGLWVGDRPVLRPWSGRPEDGPFSVASIVLAPVSNRVSRPFDWGGRTHALPRNLATEAFPIHGDAFARPWRVAARDQASVRLELDDGGFGPLLYSASLTHALVGSGYASELSITSRCAEPMPFGGGFHPWFPRDRETRLTFTATGVWLEDDRHLPAGDRPVAVPEAWDFSGGKALPEGWINNGFSGWDGRLRIAQGAAAVPVRLTAGSALDTLILFSPGAGADFFCAEPVTHPVDAVNLPGRPGVVVLEPGETMRVRMRMEWDT
jgi:aldose 1-epimerase